MKNFAFPDTFRFVVGCFEMTQKKKQKENIRLTLPSLETETGVNTTCKNKVYLFGRKQLIDMKNSSTRKAKRESIQIMNSPKTSLKQSYKGLSRRQFNQFGSRKQEKSNYSIMEISKTKSFKSVKSVDKVEELEENIPSLEEFDELSLKSSENAAAIVSVEKEKTEDSQKPKFEELSVIEQNIQREAKRKKTFLSAKRPNLRHQTQAAPLEREDRPKKTFKKTFVGKNHSKTSSKNFRKKITFSSVLSKKDKEQIQMRATNEKEKAFKISKGRDIFEEDMKIKNNLKNLIQSEKSLKTFKSRSKKSIGSSKRKIFETKTQFDLIDKNPTDIKVLSERVIDSLKKKEVRFASLKAISIENIILEEENQQKSKDVPVEPRLKRQSRRRKRKRRSTQHSNVKFNSSNPKKFKELNKLDESNKFRLKRKLKCAQSQQEDELQEKTVSIHLIPSKCDNKTTRKLFIEKPEVENVFNQLNDFRSYMEVDPVSQFVIKGEKGNERNSLTIEPVSISRQVATKFDVFHMDEKIISFGLNFARKANQLGQGSLE